MNLNKILLIGLRIIFCGLSICGLLIMFVGSAYAEPQVVRSFQRLDIWIFYGIPSLYFLYCIFSCFGLLKWKSLLLSGIAMHILVWLSNYWVYSNVDPKPAQTMNFVLSIFSALWIIHLILQAINERSQKALS